MSIKILDGIIDAQKESFYEKEKTLAFKFGGQWRFRKDEIDKWSKNKY